MEPKHICLDIGHQSCEEQHGSVQCQQINSAEPPNTPLTHTAMRQLVCKMNCVATAESRKEKQVQRCLSQHEANPTAPLPVAAVPQLVLSTA